MYFFRSLGVGTKDGYKLYSINNVEKIEQLCENCKLFIFNMHVKIHI